MSAYELRIEVTEVENLMHACAALFVMFASLGCVESNANRIEIAAPRVNARPASEEGRQLNEDWIRADLKCIERFRAALREPDLTVEALVVAFGSLEAHADLDAGFGVRRTRMHLYGGYTTIWIETLADVRASDGRSHVAELRARQLGPREEWPRLSERYALAWSGTAAPIENGFAFVRRDETLAAALRARTADGLGGAVRADVPAELSVAMNKLTSAFDNVVLGRQYGYDGAPPPGRLEIEALVNAKRVDLLRVVLRSIDPGARVYAAWALKHLVKAELSAADSAAIQTILAQKLELQTSSGCEQFWRSPADAFAFLVRGE